MDAAFAIASQTQSPVAGGLPKAQDMTRHLNRMAKHREASALKELYKYMTVPGMITMAGGIPHPEVFPFETVSASVLSHDAFPLDPPRVPEKPKKSLISWLFPSSQTQSNTVSFMIPKYGPNPSDPAAIQLSTSLQYQPATGPPALPLFLREFVAKVFKPAYADWDVLINVGATDGWSKICGMLLEIGDAILVEEWTYPGAENTFIPYETERVPIKMDGQGLLPEHLENVLGGWDESERGKKRPRVLYTIPTGQNPTGATMMAERKKAIYEVCQKYDVVICEDEPYYCLYTGEWTPKGVESDMSILAQRKLKAEKKDGPDGNQAFLDALPPSFLAFDTDGRVIRMDTFSKTSAPGSRLGWITTSPIFIERLTRATEASTQAPSGFATALTTRMIQQWGFDGYIRWLRGIKATYNMRKTWLCDTFQDVFHLEFDSGNDLFPERSRTVTCYSKQTRSLWDEKRGLRGPALITFIPPTAGMFVFLGIHFSEHPDYYDLLRRGEDATFILSKKLWEMLADNLVLFAPGWGFDAGGEHAIGGKGYGYYRLAFSVASYEEIRDGIYRFSQVLDKFFRI
uniref:Aromatic amino acid aminotransferase I n=1 Tax=Cryptococcus bacillisporus CA1280 TaxID=1296109 RepID=A0A0D0TJ00_CRYGA|nr:aromatic amino acid aminotransferase I [Cryptococcus bacillisporus CA1280]